MSLRFGTDGVRGDADTDLTSPLVVALGRAAARVLGADQQFLIGRDTRESGPRIEQDLTAGLRAEGAPVESLGVLPTPGVAYLASVEHAAAAMISASHNPWRDNGIKLFAPGGRKLDDRTEARIEDALHGLLDDEFGSTPSSGASSPPKQHGHVAYTQYLIDRLEGRDLGGMRIAIDCANGSASGVAREVLERANAHVRAIHEQPNGRNINEHCGSTHPEELQRVVVANGCRAGLAFDGDADRVIAVDEHGALVDGDQIMVAAALDLHARGALRNDAIAVTVMSNLGLRRALSGAGIGVVETAVGDRNVLLALDEHDLMLGGEQSGHIVFRDHARTGDGLLTGLVLLDLMARLGQPLSALAAEMTRFPQVLVSVRTGRQADLSSVPELAAAIEASESRLGDQGRVLVRASGTEPVVRVMVEAATAETAETEAEHLVSVVRAAFSKA